MPTSFGGTGLAAEYEGFDCPNRGAREGVGLVVGCIHDIVDEAITVRRQACANGIFGSAVIQDRVTDLLDVPTIIRAAAPSFYCGVSSTQLAA